MLAQNHTMSFLISLLYLNQVNFCRIARFEILEYG